MLNGGYHSIVRAILALTVLIGVNTAPAAGLTLRSPGSKLLAMRAGPQQTHAVAAKSIENFQALSPKEKVEAMNLAVANMHKRLNDFFSKDTLVGIARHKQQVEQTFRVEDITDADPEVDAPSLAGTYLASVLITLFESGDKSLTENERIIGEALYNAVPDYSRSGEQGSQDKNTPATKIAQSEASEVGDVVTAVRWYYALMHLGLLDIDAGVRSWAEAEKDQGPRVLRGTDYFLSLYGGKAFRRQDHLQIPVTVMIVRRMEQHFISVERFYSLNIEGTGLPDRVPDSAETGVQPSRYRDLSFVDGDVQIQLHEQQRDRATVADGERILWLSPKDDQPRADAMVQQLVSAVGNATGPNKTILVDCRTALESGSRADQIQQRLAEARAMVAQRRSTPPVSSSSAQAQPPNRESTIAPNDLPEITQQEEAPSFRVKVNLVELRVVVRDAKGNAVGNLKQEDFILFDEKRQQAISRFAVERHEPYPAVESGQAVSTVVPNQVNPSPAKNSRLAYLIDDFNATASDLARVRKALEKAIDSLEPDQLLAILTLSGQNAQDFTRDKEKLRAALRGIKPTPQAVTGHTDCPPINYYMADQASFNAPLFTAIVEAIRACQFAGQDPEHVDPKLLQALARQAISRELNDGDLRTKLALEGFNAAVIRVSAQPGQRSMVLLSSGFYGVRQQAGLNEILDRAVRSGVIISALDFRGLYMTSTLAFDAGEKTPAAVPFAQDIYRYRAASDSAQSDPLMQVAAATGGVFIHNTNDLTHGLEKVSKPPEYSYLMAFSPQNLQNNGKFHQLKVELRSKGLTVQARKGYYAPTEESSATQAKREIDEALFGPGEIHELPVRVQNQVSPLANGAAKLNVLVQVDVRQMHFKRTDGRNRNQLVVVAAVFDHEAKLVSAKSNTVNMHIKDETLANGLESGISLRSNFELPAGSYVVRVIARDADGKMTAQSSGVQVR